MLAVVYPTAKELMYLRRLKKNVILIKVDFDGVYYEAGRGFKKFENAIVNPKRIELFTVEKDQLLTDGFVIEKRNFSIRLTPLKIETAFPPSPSFCEEEKQCGGLSQD